MRPACARLLQVRGRVRPKVPPGQREPRPGDHAGLAGVPDGLDRAGQADSRLLDLPFLEQRLPMPRGQERPARSGPGIVEDGEAVSERIPNAVPRRRGDERGEGRVEKLDGLLHAALAREPGAGSSGVAPELGDQHGASLGVVGGCEGSGPAAGHEAAEREPVHPDPRVWAVDPAARRADLELPVRGIGPERRWEPGGARVVSVQPDVEEPAGPVARLGHGEPHLVRPRGGIVVGNQYDGLLAEAYVPREVAAAAAHLDEDDDALRVVRGPETERDAVSPLLRLDGRANFHREAPRGASEREAGQRADSGGGLEFRSALELRAVARWIALHCADLPRAGVPPVLGTASDTAGADTRAPPEPAPNTAPRTGVSDAAQIRSALEAADHRVEVAARALGLSRNTLRARMREHGIRRAADIEAAELDEARAYAGDDVAAMAAHLGVGEHALRIRIGQIERG